MTTFHDPIDIARLLAAGVVGDAEYHATISSTQDRARAAAVEGVRGPFLVVAEDQTAGRGRGANRWWTGAGSLAFSLLLDPADWQLPSQNIPLRSLAAGVGIVDAVAPRLDSPELGLHWPNDVFVGERKLAGILIDLLPDGRHVLGIGININNSLIAAPADVQNRATSLAELTGRVHDRTDVLIAMLENLQLSFHHAATDPPGFAVRFQELCLQIGRELHIESGLRQIVGRCLGIAADGALLIETPAGVEAVYSGVLR